MKKILVTLLLGLNCIVIKGCGIYINAPQGSTDTGTNVVTEEIENKEEDIYGYNIAKAFQLTSDIQALSQQTNYYIDGHVKGFISDEEFTENITELADKYGELDIDFLEETKYYNSMCKGIQDTRYAMYAMSSAVNSEDGKTLIQSTSQVIEGQKLITQTLNQMNEDLKTVSL